MCSPRKFGHLDFLTLPSSRLQIGERSKKRANFAPPWVIVDSVGRDNLSVEYFIHDF